MFFKINYNNIYFNWKKNKIIMIRKIIKLKILKFYIVILMEFF